MIFLRDFFCSCPDLISVESLSDISTAGRPWRPCSRQRVLTQHQMKIDFLPNTKPPPTFHKNFGRKLTQCFSTVSIVLETRSHAMRVQESRHEIWVLHQKVGRCQVVGNALRGTDNRPPHPLRESYTSHQIYPTS